ncbi:hypothetical protein LCI18_012343 [Fusarium solani-melongenae]|uniref:Uncharacterized protein n=1 Tax=Fusarium solani subsp. cucurbitae TaxID=2747967 RepID=A0ACD3ZJB1_FUSSC|nr:hypothetical protein LCI18_012343 [Fusarium solani-melongenae]
MAERSSSPPRRLRSCVSCTKAKAKCRFQQENVARHLCDRCQGLNIECTPQSTKSLRRPRRINISDSSTTLEQTTVSGVHKNNDIGGHERGAGGLIKNNQQADSPLNSQTLQPPFGLSWPQATLALTTFRQNHTSHFPFVTVKEDLTTEDLYKEKPFLFRAIMLVASPLPRSRAVKMKRNTLAYLGYRMLVEEERTLDLLQGLIVVAAWAHTCHIDEGQVTNLAFLGLGYAHKLGITQIPSSSPEQVNSNSQSGTSGLTEKMRQEVKTHSLDEQRCLLGLYCVLSVISTKQSRSNPLDPTHIDICCNNISASQNTTSSPALEHLVRFIEMSERLSKGFGEPHERTLSRPYAFLLEGNGRRFRADLERLAEVATRNDPDNHHRIFQLYHQYTLVRLYEPAVMVADHPDEGVAPFVYLLICLRNCLDAIRSFFDLLLSSPPEDILKRSIVTTDQAAFVMVLAARLLLIDAPGWDPMAARQTLDLSVVLGKIQAHVEKAEAQHMKAMQEFASVAGDMLSEEENAEESTLGELATNTRLLKEWYETRLEGEHADKMPSMHGFLVEARDGETEEGMTRLGGLLNDIAWNFRPFGW